ncbi:MAG: dienelactone hydrolase family protein [Ignavibacteriales bacterium]|nr:dienelactone hydrolase family protein [Ignavibacteriales bacterium]
MMMTSLAPWASRAAALPVRADTVITTSAEGLDGRRGEDPGGGRRDARLPRHAGRQGRALPDGAGRAGDLRRARAHQGRLPALRQGRATCAIAPELYARQGDVSQAHRHATQIFAQVVAKVPDAQVMSDLDAAAAWAGEATAATPRKLGVTGFCWGGRITWLYAAHNRDLKAGVAWYGRLSGRGDGAAAEVSARRRRRRSMRRCSGCTAARTRASRSPTSRRCVRRSRRRSKPSGDRRVPRKRARASSPTIGRAIERSDAARPARAACLALVAQARRRI